MRIFVLALLIGVMAPRAFAQAADPPAVCNSSATIWSAVSSGSDVAAMQRVRAQTPAVCTHLLARIDARIAAVAAPHQQASAAHPTPHAPADDDFQSLLTAAANAASNSQWDQCVTLANNALQMRAGNASALFQRAACEQGQSGDENTRAAFNDYQAAIDGGISGPNRASAISQTALMRSTVSQIELRQQLGRAIAGNWINSGGTQDCAYPSLMKVDNDRIVEFYGGFNVIFHIAEISQDQNHGFFVLIDWWQNGGENRAVFGSRWLISANQIVTQPENGAASSSMFSRC